MSLFFFLLIMFPDLPSLNASFGESQTFGGEGAPAPSIASTGWSEFQSEEPAALTSSGITRSSSVMAAGFGRGRSTVRPVGSKYVSMAVGFKWQFVAPAAPQPR